MVRPDLKCLVFTTGKVVFTGAKSEDMVYEAFAQLYPLLLDFKVDRVAAPLPSPKRAAPSSKKW
jgi:transcription initiation factor TFIID TATA-box-binding protein